MIAPASPFHVACPTCGAQPERFCTGVPPHAGPYHLDRRIAWRRATLAIEADAQPAVDVGGLRRHLEIATLALDAIARSTTHPNARGLAEQALRAVHGRCESTLGTARCEHAAGHRGGHVYTVTRHAPVPLEMDDDLRARLARDSAALHDGTH